MSRCWDCGRRRSYAGCASDYAVITDAQSGIVGGTAVTAAAAVTVYERNTLAFGLLRL